MAHPDHLKHLIHFVTLKENVTALKEKNYAYVDDRIKPIVSKLNDSAEIATLFSSSGYLDVEPDYDIENPETNNPWVMFSVALITANELQMAFEKWVITLGVDDWYLVRPSLSRLQLDSPIEQGYRHWVYELKFHPYGDYQTNYERVMKLFKDMVDFIVGYVGQ